MKGKVSSFISKHHLLQPNEQILVALSGGADSVALLLLLCDLGYDCVAVHCNFHLRGEESMRDEKFVQNLCEQNHTKLFIRHFQTKEFARENKLSIEMAARQQRYVYFEELAHKLGVSSIAVAHHQDDQAETMLINLCRGTGIKGLRGMLPRNGKIIRPFLCITKHEILNYLSGREQSYIDDSTNFDNSFVRNKIRLDVLPILSTVNSRMIENFSRSAENLMEVENIYNEVVDDLLKRFVRTQQDGALLIDGSAMLNHRYANALLHELLMPHGFTSAQIEEIRQGCQSGKKFLAANKTLWIDREKWLLSDTITEENVPMLDTTLLNVDSFVLQKTNNVAFVDASLIRGELQVRKADQSDWFIPFGMKGKKLVSRYLTDIKMPLWQKKEQYVITDESGNILWLVGQRLDNRYAVTASTKQVLRIALKTE
ncbi:MAG: tRNA lysidine(34) synthetase TilS [Bacteroidales bacterium]|nr:tRNA lysidine(34) synthetase TilS [Candidatus Minthousia equi]